MIKLIKNNKKLIKFLFVWISSTLVDLWFLYFFVEVLEIKLFISIVLSFILAVINGFTWNKIWTFSDKSIRYKRQFTKFLFVSIGGLILTLSFMFIFHVIFGIYYILAKLITSVIVVVWNFLWNKYWTFSLKNITNIEKQNFHIKYSVIIPAYNENERIWNTLKQITKYFQKWNTTYEIILVDDGSIDSTVEFVRSLWIHNLLIVENRKNKWKWYSVKQGVLASQWKYILFTDADNSTPIEELENLKMYIEDYPIVIWSRYCNNAKVQIEQSWFRKKIWRIWNKIIQYFLLEWIADTQCWFKLFQYNVAKKVFWLQKINGFWFDMEILLAGKSMWYAIKEVPVSWYNSELSRVRPIRDSLKTFCELIFIKINYWFDWYK